ncbi:TrbC/VirB2 family protein [Erwinia amylovora]|uniref:TrbC/VirB2 family protein n=1 Tax=Erwinia amylovora TaxID=552 RepID=UPI0020C119CC|nr:TrbC/VirB2 family protein [Erwinia amylovora]MCK8373815.1 TrbC/VirB2 family protein [Erwinia amylovora]
MAKAKFFSTTFKLAGKKVEANTAKKADKSKLSQTSGLFALVAALVFFPQMAFAAGGDPIGDGLQWLIDLLTSGIARSAAILAIVALGYMTWAGRIQFKHAGFAIGGIVLVFGGATIADLIIAAVS